ncbi:uncharacterized protein METZ01_LOCUS119577, partial [marine metagenome]
VVQKESEKINAIIVDLDGTLAILNNRGPFEWENVENDNLNRPIAELIAMSQKHSYKTIILSGRDEAASEKTIKWLNQNDIIYDKLYLRPSNNQMSNADYKRMIFINEIQAKYNVLFILEDLPEVVKMWRDDFDLTVFQIT